MNKRVNNIEFKWSDTNKAYELIQWFPKDSCEYCIVIAFFHPNSEGYDMETVSRRYLDAYDQYPTETIAVTRYAFSVLQAEHKLKDETFIYD